MGRARRLDPAAAGAGVVPAGERSGPAPAPGCAAGAARGDGRGAAGLAARSGRRFHLRAAVDPDGRDAPGQGRDRGGGRRPSPPPSSAAPAGYGRDSGWPGRTCSRAGARPVSRHWTTFCKSGPITRKLTTWPREPTPGRGVPAAADRAPAEDPPAGSGPRRGQAPPRFACGVDPAVIRYGPCARCATKARPQGDGGADRHPVDRLRCRRTGGAAAGHRTLPDGRGRVGRS